MTHPLRRPLHRAHLLLGVFVVVLGACSSPGNDTVGTSRVVVTTISILADFVTAVAQDSAEVVSMVDVGGDPHTYEPTPADARVLFGADLLVSNGTGLEPWLEPMLRAARADLPHLAASEGLEPLLAEDGLLAGEPDPHMWMDPQLAAAYVETIRDSLAALSPEREEVYARNAAAYLAELRELDSWIREAVGTIPPHRRKLVTSHDAFRYFGNRYGLEVVGTIWSISTEREPSADEIRRLIDGIREFRVPVVFTETTINPRLMQRVAADAGVEVGAPLYGDSVGEPGSGAETYVGMMRANTRAIVGGLGGTVP